MSNQHNDGMTLRRGTTYAPSTIREDDRSVEFVLATEAPAEVFSRERWQVIREVLLADGVILPESKQIPLLDSHDRNSTKAVLGSVREIRIENSRVVGRLYFARAPEAVDEFNKIKDGHLDSGSVGYKPMGTWIEAGERIAYNGKEYEGPLQLTKTWELREFSLVAIGADPGAKARSEPINPSREAANTCKEALQMSENKTPVIPPADEAARMAAEAANKLADATRILAEAERKSLDMRIRELCSKHNMPEIAAKMVDQRASYDAAADAVLAEIERRQQTVSSATIPTVAMGVTDDDKRAACMTDAIMMRGMPGNHGIEKPEPGEFRGRTLLDIGADILERSGVRTRGLTKEEVARKLILSARNAIATDNTTASFSNLTSNVMNKATIRGFMAQGRVWDSICSVGSTSDFKTVTRVGLSENADLPLKREGAEYRESKFSDRAETGSVATYADKTTLTEEAIIDDNLSALASIPFRKGAAAMRVPEALLFAAINTPPTLTATSRAWFSDSNTVDNDLTNSGGLNSTNLSTARATMRKMPVHKSAAETATDYYDIMPRTLLVHPDYEDTAKILVASRALPQVNMSEGVYNPNSDANLVVKASARITTATNFYLFADPNLFPVAEMLFLNGRVGPETFLDTSTNIDGLTYRIRIRCGLIILEWRTAVRHKSA